MFFYDINNDDFLEDTKEVLQKLQSGDWLFGINTMTVVDEDFYPLYRVELEASSDLEYEFDQE
jgi:hypothetical protein